MNPATGMKATLGSSWSQMDVVILSVSTEAANCKII